MFLNVNFLCRLLNVLLALCLLASVPTVLEQFERWREYFAHKLVVMR